MKTCEIVHCPGKTDLYALRLSHEIDGVMTLSAGYTRQEAVFNAKRHGFTIVDTTPKEWLKEHPINEQTKRKTQRIFVCVQCGKEFYSRNYSSKTCSYDCKKAEAKKVREERRELRPLQASDYRKICLNCNSPFTAVRTTAMYCDAMCKSQYNEKHRRGNKSAGIEVFA
jgi:hypothetical protein